MTDSEDSPQEPPPRPRFQFSLRAQMITVTVIAILLGLWVLVGQTVAWIVFYAVVYCLAPTPLIIGALFGRCELRTFSIGALVPWIGAWSRVSPLPMIFYPQNVTQGAFIGLIVGSTVFMLVAAAACGALAVVTRRWIERTAKD